MIQNLFAYKNTHKWGGSELTVTRRAAIAYSLTCASALRPSTTRAADTIKVGSLRFVSSGGLFMARELGFFQQEGLEPEIIFFDAAQPVAVAVASGDIGFGTTSITGGTLNLAAKKVLRAVASQGSERKGYKGNAFLVSNAAYSKGLTSLDKLAGASVAITQVGSSQHYMLGQAADAFHVEMASIVIRPLQSVANMIAAVRSGQVDATILPPQYARPMEQRGEVKRIAYVSDVADYQYGALFASTKLLTSSRDTVARFARAYVKGNTAYAKALLRRDKNGDFVIDAEAREAARIMSSYIYPTDHSVAAIDNILSSLVFIDAEGRLNPAEIDRQIGWFQRQKLVGAGVSAADFVDTSFTF